MQTGIRRVKARYLILAAAAAIWICSLTLEKTVKYEVYKVVNGSDVYQYTITQDTQLDWRWFWYKITFYDEGKYNIYLYDCNDYLLTSGSVRIQYK